MNSNSKNLPAQVIDVRPRDELLHKKWKPKNESVTPSGNSHYVFSNRQEEENFYSFQFDTEEKKKKYKDYREAWWQRASEYEYGDAPLALIV